MSPAKPRVLVISMGPVGAEMAGSGIRALELARALREHAEVTLAATDVEGEAAGDGEREAGVALVPYQLRDPRALRGPIAAADAIVAQPQWPLSAHWMRRSGARLIFDLYDPEPLEVMQALSQRSVALRSLVSTLTLDRVIDALFSGHHFICASGKQRDMWIGMMVALRLLGPRTYDRDPSLSSVIAQVPFGLPAEPPLARADGPGLRRRFAGRISREDEVVLWNGGIWNWLDAPTAVRAMAHLKHPRPQAKLVFMGATDVTQARRATQQARAIAAELGVLDSSVLFNDGWVPYAERGQWLLEADCAVSTQVEHLETRFAFRTRLLDCFWARLPIVCTRGDELADRVERDDLGAVVPERDPQALAKALQDVLERGRDSYEQALSRVAQDYAWSRVVEPLIGLIASQRPPPLGQGVARPALAWARTAAFRGAVGTMNALGIQLWPSLERRGGPVISVVVPVKDGGSDLARCLDGIRSQAVAEEVEIVVIDSGSSDGSVGLARAHGALVREIPARRVQPRGRSQSRRAPGQRRAARVHQPGRLSGRSALARAPQRSAARGPRRGGRLRVSAAARRGQAARALLPELPVWRSRTPSDRHANAPADDGDDALLERQRRDAAARSGSGSRSSRTSS